MKKIIIRASALLLALLLLFSLSGCKKNKSPAEPTANISVNTPAAQPQDAASPEAAEPPAPSAEPTPRPAEQPAASSAPADAPPEISPSPESAEQDTGEEQSARRELDEDGYYYDVENVALYIDTYGKLPPNYVTKKEAQALGWSGGSVEKYRDGAAIGGDRFGNYEGLLPKAGGRSYTECDIDTDGSKSRGAKRLVFSNDGLFFYTEDHYESFTELTVTQNGEIEWK